MKLFVCMAIFGLVQLHPLILNGNEDGSQVDQETLTTSQPTEHIPNIAQTTVQTTPPTQSIVANLLATCKHEINACQKSQFKCALRIRTCCQTQYGKCRKILPSPIFAFVAPECRDFQRSCLEGIPKKYRELLRRS